MGREREQKRASDEVLQHDLSLAHIFEDGAKRELQRLLRAVAIVKDELNQSKGEIRGCAVGEREKQMRFGKKKAHHVAKDAVLVGGLDVDVADLVNNECRRERLGRKAND